MSSGDDGVLQHSVRLDCGLHRNDEAVSNAFEGTVTVYVFEVMNNSHIGVTHAS